MTSKPYVTGAIQYAMGRLESELAPRLVFHSVWHTRDDVVPAVERFAEMEGVIGDDRLLLLTAAYFHDLGFVELRTGHEVVSIRIAREVLPSFGYQPHQIDVIENIIRATKLPQTPHTLLEQIMADADLDALGRDDYFPRNLLLRQELINFNLPSTLEEWDEIQLSFLEAHHYFTQAAINLRGPAEKRHIEILTDRIRRRGGTPIWDGS
jgi:uncharacterized protein